MKKDTPNKPKTDQNNTAESPPRDRKISSDISRKSSALSSAVAKRRAMSFRLCVPTNIRKEEEVQILIKPFSFIDSFINPVLHSFINPFTHFFIIQFSFN